MILYYTVIISKIQPGIDEPQKLCFRMVRDKFIRNLNFPNLLFNHDKALIDVEARVVEEMDEQEEYKATENPEIH